MLIKILKTIIVCFGIWSKKSMESFKKVKTWTIITIKIVKYDFFRNWFELWIDMKLNKIFFSKMLNIFEITSVESTIIISVDTWVDHPVHTMDYTAVVPFLTATIIHVLHERVLYFKYDYMFCIPIKQERGLFENFPSITIQDDRQSHHIIY